MCISDHVESIKENDIFGLSLLGKRIENVAAMFDGYTMNQLLELRAMCADMIEQTDEIQRRADNLLFLQHIDEELAEREYKKSA